MVNSSNKDFFIPLPLFPFKALRCAPQNIFTGMKMKKNMNVLYFLPYPQRNECMILKSQIITPWRCHENNSKFKSLIRSHKISTGTTHKRCRDWQKTKNQRWLKELQCKNAFSATWSFFTSRKLDVTFFKCSLSFQNVMEEGSNRLFKFSLKFLWFTYGFMKEIDFCYQLCWTNSPTENNCKN